MKSVEIDRSKRLSDQPKTGHNRWHPDVPPILEADEGEEVVLETRDGVDGQLGPSVTEVYGPARGFIVFTVAGAIGFVVSNLIAHTPTVGASGSIFGLIAALIVYGRRTGHSMMTQQLWTWAAIMFVMGFFMGNVNNFAHAGGFAGGYAAAYLMPSRDQRRETLVESLTAIALLLATVAGFVLSFVKVTGILLTH